MSTYPHHLLYLDGVCRAYSQIIKHIIHRQLELPFLSDIFEGVRFGRLTADQAIRLSEAALMRLIVYISIKVNTVCLPDNNPGTLEA